MPSRASPPAAPWCSCCRQDRWRRRFSSAAQTPCGSLPSSMTSSSRPSIGRAAQLTHLSCWPPASSSSWRCFVSSRSAWERRSDELAACHEGDDRVLRLPVLCLPVRSAGGDEHHRLQYAQL